MANKKKHTVIRRVERVTVLLDEDEKNVLEAYANRVGVSQAAAIRLALASTIPNFGKKGG